MTRALAPAQTRRRQLVSGDEAVVVMRDPTTPCGDCPFARTALAGWLADSTPAAWLAMAHGETRMECHTQTRVDGGVHCAGAAIYRANVCKLPRHPDAAYPLPADRALVFATPHEFVAHHTEGAVDRVTRIGGGRVLVEQKAAPAHPPRRRLGSTQHALLQSLQQHRGWSRGCGWVWDTERGTERILGPLVARGFVEIVLRPGHTASRVAHYQLTAAGRAAAERPR